MSRSLTAEESHRLSDACGMPPERIVVWNLLDTGLRISELCGLNAKNIPWQRRQLRIKGKGGSQVKRTKVRVVPMSNACGHSSFPGGFPWGTLGLMVGTWPNRPDGPGLLPEREPAGPSRIRDRPGHPGESRVARVGDPSLRSPGALAFGARRTTCRR